jgi:phosphatidylglycerophosphatase A
MTDVTVPSPRPSLKHLSVLLATWFGSGYLPKAPGTWGSLAALPCAWFLVQMGGILTLAISSFVVFFVGLWASKDFMERTKSHDPGAIVIDEVVGMWIVLLLAPLDPIAYSASFILFRLFDIFKPWPISWADTTLGGAWGVMLDDVLAGLFGLAVFYMVITYGTPHLGG